MGIAILRPSFASRIMNSWDMLSILAAAQAIAFLEWPAPIMLASQTKLEELVPQQILFALITSIACPTTPPLHMEPVKKQKHWFVLFFYCFCFWLLLAFFFLQKLVSSKKKNKNKNENEKRETTAHSRATTAEIYHFAT